MAHDTHSSEFQWNAWKPLQPSESLQTDQEALYVPGIGPIAQWHCYVDMLWSHGIPYFVRDYLFKEIEQKLESGTPPKDVRGLVRRLNSINSKIWAHEAECRSQESRPPPPPGTSRPS